MPTVPRYDEPRVRPAGLPGVDISSSAPAEAFGGGRAGNIVSRSVAGVMKVEEQAADLQLKAAKEAHQLRMSQIDREIGDEYEKPAIFDEKTGAMSRRGQAALGVGADLDKSFMKYVDEKRKGLATEAQRRDFEFMVESKRQKIQEWSRTYENRQITEFKVGEHSSGIENAKDRAARWGDDKTAGEELKKLRFHVGDLGVMGGWGPERTAAELQKQETDFHSRVIAQRIAKQDRAGARSYFETYKAGMDPAAALKIQQDLQEDDRRSKAFGIIDRIFSDTRVREYTGAGNNWTLKGEAAAQSWDEARDRIKREAGDDADLRLMTEQMGRQRWGEIEHGRIVAREATYDASLKKVLENPAVNPRMAIDPTTWNMLSGAQQKSLLSVFEPPDKNDDQGWLIFSSLTDAEIRTVPLSEYHSKFWSKFNKHYRDKADTLRRQALEAGENPKKAEEWKSRISDDELMLGAFVSAGLAGEDMGIGGVIRHRKTLEEIAKDPASAAAWLAFKEDIDSKSQAFFTKFGKNAGDKELKVFIKEVADKRRRLITLDRDWPFHANQPVRVVDLTNDQVKGYQFVELQNDTKALEVLYAVAKQSQAAPSGLSPLDFYEKFTDRVNRAYLVQFREPDLTDEQLKLRWKKILSGEE